MEKFTHNKRRGTASTKRSRQRDGGQSRFPDLDSGSCDQFTVCRDGESHRYNKKHSKTPH